MYKKILLLLLIMALTVSFVGCGEGKNAGGAQDTVETFIDALADLDAKTAKKCLKDGETTQLNLDSTSFNRAGMIGEYEQVGIEKSEAEAIVEKIAEVNKQLVTYKVKDVETKEKTATVTVTFSVKDPSDIWDEILTSDDILLAYATESQGAIVLKSYEMLEKKLEVVSAKPVNVKFTLENTDDGWRISKMSDNVTEVY